MVELILAFCANVVDFNQRRKNKNRDFYNDLIKDTFQDLQLIQEDYISIMKSANKIINSQSNEYEMLEELKMRRLDLMYLRDNTHSATKVLKSIYNPHSKKEKDIKLGDYISAIDGYFHIITGFYHERPIDKDGDGQTYSISLINLISSIYCYEIDYEMKKSLFDSLNKELNLRWKFLSEAHSNMKLLYLQ